MKVAYHPSVEEDSPKLEKRPSFITLDDGKKAPIVAVKAEKLGSGGFGCVYRFFDAKQNKSYAVKFPHMGVSDIKEQYAAFKRFYSDTYKIKRMDVEILMMPYLGRQNMDMYLRSHAQSADKQANFLVFIKAILAWSDATFRFRNRGFGQTDSSPDNVMYDGETAIPIDFGLAREFKNSKDRDNFYTDIEFFLKNCNDGINCLLEGREFIDIQSSQKVTFLYNLCLVQSAKGVKSDIILLNIRAEIMKLINPEISLLRLKAIVTSFDKGSSPSFWNYFKTPITKTLLNGLQELEKKGIRTVSLLNLQDILRPYQSKLAILYQNPEIFRQTAKNMTAIEEMMCQISEEFFQEIFPRPAPRFDC